MTEDCSRVTQPRIAPCAVFLKQSAAHRPLGFARPPALLPLNETRGPQVGMAGAGGPWRTCCCALPRGQGEVTTTPASFAHQNESRQSDQTSPSTRPMQYAGNATMKARQAAILLPGFCTQIRPRNSAWPSCRRDFHMNFSARLPVLRNSLFTKPGEAIDEVRSRDRAANGL